MAPPGPRQGLSKSTNVKPLLSKVGGTERGKVGTEATGSILITETPRRGTRVTQNRQQQLRDAKALANSVEDSPDPLTARAEVDVAVTGNGNGAVSGKGMAAGGSGAAVKGGRAKKSPTPGDAGFEVISPTPPPSHSEVQPRRSNRSGALSATTAAPLPPKSATVTKPKGKAAGKKPPKVDEDGFKEIGMTTEEEDSGDEESVSGGSKKEKKSDGVAEKAKKSGVSGTVPKSNPPPKTRKDTAKAAPAAAKAGVKSKDGKSSSISSISDLSDMSDSDLDMDIDRIISKREKMATKSSAATSTATTRGKKVEEKKKVARKATPPTVEKTISKKFTAKEDSGSDIEPTNFYSKSKTIAKKDTGLGFKTKESDAKGALLGKKSVVPKTSIVLDDADLDRDELNNHFTSTPKANALRAKVTYKKRGGHQRGTQTTVASSQESINSKSTGQLEKPKKGPKVEDIHRPAFFDPRTFDAPKDDGKSSPKRIKSAVFPKKSTYNPLLDDALLDSPDPLHSAQIFSQLSRDGSEPVEPRSPSKKRKTVYLSDSEISTLSSAPSSPKFHINDADISLPNLDLDISFLNESSTQVGPPSCAICHEPFDDDFLATISSELADEANSRRPDVQAQLDRCKDHKRATAEKQCRERKYPALDIDWKKLRARITKHIPHLCEILEQKKRSEYRDGLGEEAMRKTKNKGARKLFESDFQSHTPGYYGPKGAHVMLDTIMQKLANRIRELGANDRLIAGGGVSGFVQAVLVPELGVRLVMEDMAVNEDKAKLIVRDTVEIGELVNDDDGGEIDDDEDDDEEVEEVVVGNVAKRSRRGEEGEGEGRSSRGKEKERVKGKVRERKLVMEL